MYGAGVHGNGAESMGSVFIGGVGWRGLDGRQGGRVRASDSVVGYVAIAVNGEGRVPAEGEVGGARLYDKVPWRTTGNCGDTKGTIGSE